MWLRVELASALALVATSILNVGQSASPLPEDCLMNIRVDPENNEPRALFQLARIDGRDVLEVGCGDGRLTWRYAAKAARVIAIDPFEPSILRARKSLPQELLATVEFRHTAFADFAASCKHSAFDVVILSWSLC